jgi:hypothetical protein
MTFKDKVKERYFEKKAVRCCMTVKRVQYLCKDRLPSDQMEALCEVLTEILGLDDSKDLDKHIDLED